MRNQKLPLRHGFGAVWTAALTLALAFAPSACPIARAEDASEPAPAPSQRQQSLLDANWSFHLGDITPTTDVISPTFDDKAWPHVDVPHDYILDGSYASTNDRGHGYLPIDVGWYRKHFVIPQSNAADLLKLDFDGVFRDCEVFLNGQSLGKHESGYTPFSFDITKLAKRGADNILAVRVDPRKGEGWWYEGGGIYRHVHLTTLAPLHLKQWGTHVVATVPGGETGAAAEAKVTIQTTVENSGPAVANFKIVCELLDPAGKVLATLQATDRAPEKSEKDLTKETTVHNPALWSLESPKLYSIRTTIFQNDKPLDSSITPFGIRTLRYDANKGFFLNGQHVEIQGTACHQDLAGVGIAVPDSLQAWRVAQLKKTGCNAWRTAHNPPSEALLDACDKLGMLVMDENRHLGDAYTNHSKKGTTANDLSDLATMIQRDRNHPSIIMWSMCNEEGLQGSPEGAAIFTKMMQVVHRYDQTRPITSAMNNGWLSKSGDADVEDIIGVNYNTEKYDAIHKRHPNKAMFGSEDTNEKTTRGEYADVPATGMRSAYNLSVDNWQAVITRPFMAGSFTWTGFDYKGEPNPYGWPDVSNNTGLLDTCGFPKDKAFYFQSCWTEKPMVHIVPSQWNTAPADGKPVRVLAFSNAKKVELFLNDKSLGSKDMPHDGLVEWSIPFEPGTLLAKASDGDNVVATDEQQTTGKPARIKLDVDRTDLKAAAQDAVVVTVTLYDAKGRVVPDADNRITFALKGNGKILGVGNGNPADHDPDKATSRKAFHAHCIAILQAGPTPGDLELTATSEGLTGDKVTFKMQ